MGFGGSEVEGMVSPQGSPPQDYDGIPPPPRSVFQAASPQKTPQRQSSGDSSTTQVLPSFLHLRLGRLHLSVSLPPHDTHNYPGLTRTFIVKVSCVHCIGVQLRPVAAWCSASLILREYTLHYFRKVHCLEGLKTSSAP